MTTDTQIISDLPVPPGEYLEEVREALGMSKGELATRMGRPLSKLSQIFNGSKAVTPDTALELERATGVAAHIWTGLEMDYRLSLAKRREQEREEQLAAQTHFVPLFCYSHLVKAGAVKAFTRPIDKVRELQTFFRVMSLESVLQIPRYQVAHRHGAKAVDDRSPEAVAVWLRVGEVRAQAVECEAFSKERLRDALPEIRQLTRREPEEFEPRLKTLLAEAGVALVLCPHFPKTKAQGATFFLTEEKAVLMMTLRYRWADIFWFTLFHEIGHLLLHKVKDAILEDGAKNQMELEADAFARDTLIKPSDWERFITFMDSNEKTIQAFSDDQGICPGIVVGRLQHENHLEPHQFNELRARYAFAEDAGT